MAILLHVLIVVLGLVVGSLLLLLGLAGIGYAMFAEPYRPVSRRHQLDLPPDWPAVSILHISDLHVRRNDQRLFRAQRAALEGMQPDLLCVTGDVCEKVEDIDMVVSLLETVKPRLGTFVILGNHEHDAPLPFHLRELHTRGWRKWVGEILTVLGPGVRSDGEDEGHAMMDALRAAGVTVLHNQGQRVHVGGRTSMWIAGCDSAWAGHADMLATMRGRRPGEPCLALIHEPDLAFEAHDLGADLILAGHTHGGQVRLPVLGAVYTHRMDPRIAVASGFQKIGSSLLYITTGLGHTIPLRFGCPPEVVWFDCAPATGAGQPDLSRAA